MYPADFRSLFIIAHPIPSFVKDSEYIISHFSSSACINASNRFEATSSKVSPKHIVFPIYCFSLHFKHITHVFKFLLLFSSVRVFILSITLVCSPDTMYTSAFGE